MLVIRYPEITKASPPELQDVEKDDAEDSDGPQYVDISAIAQASFLSGQPSTGAHQRRDNICDERGRAVSHKFVAQPIARERCYKQVRQTERRRRLQ
jgi:hypothetical protein